MLSFTAGIVSVVLGISCPVRRLVATCHMLPAPRPLMVLLGVLLLTADSMFTISLGCLLFHPLPEGRILWADAVFSVPDMQADKWKYMRPIHESSRNTNEQNPHDLQVTPTFGHCTLTG